MAAAGKLIFAMAGPRAQIDRVKPLVLDVMGRKIIDCGEDVQKSALLKITGYGRFAMTSVMSANDRVVTSWSLDSWS